MSTTYGPVTGSANTIRICPSGGPISSPKPGIARTVQVSVPAAGLEFALSNTTRPQCETSDEPQAGPLRWGLLEEDVTWEPPVFGGDEVVGALDRLDDALVGVEQ